MTEQTPKTLGLATPVISRKVERTPKTQGSASSVIRLHSPWCEATGPIVQEGFVAARIQALQSLQNQAQDWKFSHSPMTPCPIRGWQQLHQLYDPQTKVRGIEQIEDAHSPSKDVSAHLCQSATCCKKRQSDKMKPDSPHDQPDLQDQNRRIWSDIPKHSTLSGPPQPTAGHEDLAEKRSPNDADASFSEKEIFSPQAIPPSLAKPSINQFSPKSPATQTDEMGVQGQIIQPRRSIAEKFGSMVDKGWVGNDALGMTLNNQRAPQVISPELQGHGKRAAHRSKSLSEGWTVGVTDDEFASNVATRAEYDARDDFLEDPKSNRGYGELRPMLYHSPGRSVQQPAKESSITRPVLFRSSSEVREYSGQEPAILHFTSKRRAWTLHNPDRSIGDPKQHIKLRTLSSSQGIKRFHSSEDVTGDYFVRDTGSYPNEETFTHATDRAPSFESSEIARSSRVSSVAASQSKRSSSRSLFGINWSWFRLAEKQSMAQAVSRKPSAPVMKRTKRFSPETKARKYSKNVGEAHMLTDCGYKNEVGNTEANTSSLVEAGHSNGDHDATKTSPGTSVDGGFSLPAIVGATNIPAERYPQVLPDYHRTLPTTERPKNSTVGVDNAWAKADIHPSFVSSTHRSPRSSVGEAIPLSITPHSSRLNPRVFGSSTDVAKDTPRCSPRQPPEMLSGSSVQSQSSSHSPTSKRQAGDSPEILHWDSKVKGTGIKRVQVIVSLDGTDDLVIEARLQRKDNIESLRGNRRCLVP